MLHSLNKYENFVAVLTTVLVSDVLVQLDH